MPDDFGAIAELGGAVAIEMVATTLAERGYATGICHNCGAPMIAAYCAACGQERDTHRRSLWGLLHDLVADIASFDSRILRTVVALIGRPGELPLAFREGRTRRYVPAVRLYLFSSLLFFLTLSLSGIALIQIELQELPNAYAVKTLPNGEVIVISHGRTSRPIPASVAATTGDKSLSAGVHSGMTTSVHFFGRIGTFHQRISPAGWTQIEQIKTSVLRAVGNDRNGWMAKNALATIEKLGRDPAALNGPLTTWMPRFFFLLLPLFAALLGVFYVRHRKQFYFVDHLVFSLAMHSFVFAILIVAIGAAQVLPGGRVAELIFLAIAVYLFLALKRFYLQGWVVTSFKFAVISFVYVVFFLAPALLFVLLTGLVAG